MANVSNIQAQMAELGARIAGLKPTTPKFDAAVGEYTALVAAHTDAVKAANVEAIDAARKQLVGMINGAVQSLKLAALTNEPITRIVYDVITAEDGTVTATVLLNPTRTTRRASTATGGNGDRRDLKAEFEKYATAEETAKLEELEKIEDPKKRNSATWAHKNRVVTAGEAAAAKSSS